MKQRNSSFELLRIICVSLIVMMHIGALLDLQTAQSFNIAIRGGVNSIGNIGVTCFILISGYYGVKFKFDKFIYLVLATTLYSLAISYLTFGMSFTSLAKAALSVIGYTNWFMACYLILMLISPYLNKFAEALGQQEYKRMLIVLMIILSLLPTVSYAGSINNVVLRQGGKCLTYFIFIYLIGRYIRLHHDVQYNRWGLWGIHLVCTFMIFILNMIVSKIIHADCSLFNYDCSPFILLSSLCIFYLFKSWSFSNRFINWISSSVLAFYLIGNIYQFIDNKWAHLATFSASSSFYIVVIVMSFAIWILALIVDNSIGKLLNLSVGRIVAKYQKD